MKNEQQSQIFLLKVDPRSTFRNKFFQPTTNVFVARQVDHARWKTSTKTWNETMLRYNDSLRDRFHWHPYNVWSRNLWRNLCLEVCGCKRYGIPKEKRKTLCNFSSPCVTSCFFLNTLAKNVLCYTDRPRNKWKMSRSFLSLLWKSVF